MMSYRFRLTVALKSPGLFRVDLPRIEFAIGDFSCELVARDSELLSAAAKVHFDGYPFENAESATNAGLALQMRLRLLDAALGLGLNVPTQNTITGQLSGDVKRQLHEEHGVTIIDSVFGLSVYPNDGRHFEHLLAAHLQVRKRDSNYIIEGIRKLWPDNIRLDQSAEDALTMVGIATRETSPRAAFLTMFLALQALIPRSVRSNDAQVLIKHFVDLVKESVLPQRDIDSLVGALSMLNEESFSSALMRFADSIRGLEEINGTPLKKFLSTCIETRNAIAHKAVIDESALISLTTGLRQFVAGIIWSQNGISAFSIYVPGDEVIVPEDAMRMRLL